jgi:hypothetical protein
VINRLKHSVYYMNDVLLTFSNYAFFPQNAFKGFVCFLRTIGYYFPTHNKHILVPVMEMRYTYVFFEVRTYFLHIIYMKFLHQMVKNMDLVKSVQQFSVVATDLTCIRKLPASSLWRSTENPEVFVDYECYYRKSLEITPCYAVNYTFQILSVQHASSFSRLIWL